MSKDHMTRLIAAQTHSDGLTPAGIAGLSLFRATQSMPCVPAVYDPCVVAIVSGTKEAIFGGRRYVYDTSRYLCCPMSMPVQAGTPQASPNAPLYGVFISLDARHMSHLVMELDRADAPHPIPPPTAEPGIRLARWDHGFTDALHRLLLLLYSPADTAILGETRMRELFYAILRGEAGGFACQAFGASNAIARTIDHLATNLDAAISIDDMARRAGMSRAAFHRKFKQVTSMAPIQFVKTMRLNHAAMKILGGMGVQDAARAVGYDSPSQFSREFKRMYGQSPRHWADGHTLPGSMARGRIAPQLP
ncbi:MAG: AraC family transcriptional regulator [Pseudomonadota bacterium]